MKSLARLNQLALGGFVALSFTVGMSACDGDKAASDAANAPTTAKADGAEAAVAEAAPDSGDTKIEGRPVEGNEGAVAEQAGGKEEDTYTVVIEPPEDVPNGSDAMVSVKIVPQGKWHMNLEYPTSLTMSVTDGIALAKTKMVKADAKQLNDEGCEFGVGFTASSTGQKTFKGKLKFAVCQDEACAPKSEEIEFAVAVK